MFNAAFLNLSFSIGKPPRDAEPLFILDSTSKEIPLGYNYNAVLTHLKLDALFRHNAGVDFTNFTDRTVEEFRVHQVYWSDAISKKFTSFFHYAALGYRYGINKKIVESVIFYYPFVQYSHRFDSYHITFFTRVTYYNKHSRFIICEEIPDRLKTWQELEEYIPAVFENVASSTHVETDVYHYLPDDQYDSDRITVFHNTIQRLVIESFFGYQLSLDNAQRTIVSFGIVKPSNNRRSHKNTVAFDEQDVLIGIDESKLDYDRYLNRAFELVPRYSVVRDLLMMFIRHKQRNKLKGLEYEQFVICKEFLAQAQRDFNIQFSKDVDLAINEKRDIWTLLKGPMKLLSSMAGNYMSAQNE